MSIKKILANLKYTGAHDLPEYDLTRSICIGVNVICISIIILNVISGPLFYILTGSISVLFGALFEALLIFGIIALNRYKRFELANACLYGIILVATFYFSAILGRSSETQLMILFILGLIFFLFDKRPTRVFCILIALLLLVVLEANFVYHFIEPAIMSVSVAFFVRWLVYGVVISLVLLIFYLYQKNARMLIRLHTYSKQIDASLISEVRLNEIKNMYFQNISHDILSASKGLATTCQVIADALKRGEAVSESMVQTLMNAKEYLRLKLINFLAQSKFKNGSLDDIYLSAFDLREDFEMTVGNLRYLANEKGVQIQLTIPPSFPKRIIDDRLKIESILHNLLTNAIKFSKPETTIKIIITYSPLSWLLSVIDQGKGISEEQRERIFLPYVTERSIQNPEGTGLGLYIVQYFGRLLGADINLDSTIGRGSAFHIKFPLRKQMPTEQQVLESTFPSR